MSTFVSKTLRIGLLAAGLALGATPVLAQNSPAAPTAAPADSTIIAKGKNFTVTEGELKELATNIGGEAADVKDASKRPQLINILVSVKSITNAAEAAKLDKDPEFTKKVELAKQQLLIQTYLEVEAKKIVTPEALKKAYDEAVKQMHPTPEVRARHILITDKDEAKGLTEAKAILARIKKGEDFAKIAAEVSQDPGSKAKGGELGFFSKDQMVPPFAEAAFKLEVNQVSEPVKSDFGWHIIQVEEKRNRPLPTFEEMQPKLEQILDQQAQATILERVKKEADVQILDKPAVAPAAPAKK